MKLGPYHVHPILTGFFALDGGAMFGVVPHPVWSKKHPPDELGRIRLALRAMLIQGKERTILVDTGVGQKWSDKLAARYGIDLQAQRLEQELASHGISPEDVTDVILTHLHFDHAGGVTKRADDGGSCPTFPNARHYLQRRNLEAAQNPNGRERASYLEENYAPLEQAGLLTILDGPCELFPGIELFMSDGHTTGQQLVLVRGEEGDELGGLLYCGDVIPTRSHVPVAWHMGYDVRPLVIMDEKEHLLERATTENWGLFYEHDPHMSATRVYSTERGYTAGEELLFSAIV
ncbi:MAG: MBL fold metallo-hydrolase [Myxococcales bacterium]|nr:MBL fold metallo-hydrolase [Myxococcales bacterium]